MYNICINNWGRNLSFIIETNEIGGDYNDR